MTRDAVSEAVKYRDLGSIADDLYNVQAMLLALTSHSSNFQSDPDIDNSNELVRMCQIITDAVIRSTRELTDYADGVRRAR